MRPRTLTLTILLMMIASLTAAADFTEVATGTLPDGWFISRGEPGIYIEETSGKHALRIRPRAGAKQNQWDGAFVMIPETSERVIVEFTAYAPDLFRSLAVSVSYQADPMQAATSDFGAYLTIHDNAKLTYYVQGDGWFDFGGRIDPFHWNRYKMDVNVASQSFTVYVNDMDVPVGTGYFRNKVEKVNQVEFSTWGTDIKTTMWIADVNIYQP